jgi:3-oxoacyl-[acyl-carrier-protein] synthase I
MDGFIPGEGAAFLLLTHPSRLSNGDASGIAPARAIVQAAASAADSGHRSGTEPARGEGLAHALATLRARAGNSSLPVTTTFAGLNGESFDAKLWGVARVRHSDLFAPGMKLEHPTDCFGDPGAALGAILLALAATAIASGQRQAPALVWATSDGESRACALLSVSGT